ncbi:MAG TPA: PilZ domain-containing protein [Geothrix sp.]|nr:PilZ domain-containing protein [Geothrix sp.]
MNLTRSSGGGDGRDAPIDDPAQIRRAMAELKRTEAEFPIKVEGTHTLPYTSHLAHVDLDKQHLHLKLIRPLPHEMAPGAPFEMLFAVGDQRFEAPITFLGRESYLLYRFTIPVRMTQSDRRRHKRYPFRPREKAYVLAQDAGVPGHGLAGPLVNLSLGGLAFRVDRVVRLDDHLRITPGLGFFDKGKELPMLKIRDLPKLPLFEARGTLANAWEQDGEIVVGVKFGDLRDSELRQIQDVLNFRDQMQRSSGTSSVSEASVREAKARPGAPEPPDPARRVNPAGGLTPDALTRLGRRCAILMLVMAPGEARDQVRRNLEAQGYLRLELVDVLDQALERLRVNTTAKGRLVVLDLPPEVEDPLEGIRRLQRELGELRELPVAIMQQQGMPAATEDALIRPMPRPGADPAAWLPILDELAGV